MDANYNIYENDDCVMELACETLSMEQSEIQGDATVLISGDSSGTVKYEDLVRVLRNSQDASQMEFNPEVETQKLYEFFAGAKANSYLEVQSIQCGQCNVVYPASMHHTCESKDIKSVVPPSPPEKRACERITIENQVRIRRYIQEDLKYDPETSTDTPADTKKSVEKGSNECTLCDRKFVHASGLARHMEKHTLELIPAATSLQQARDSTGFISVLSCKTCGRIFYDTKLAFNHVCTHDITMINESTTEVKGTCDVDHEQNALIYGLDCLTNELNDPKLKLGSQPHPDPFRRFLLNNVLQCEFCDYIFGDIVNLLIHSSSHTPESRYECKACDLRIDTAKEASVHYQTECVFLRESMKSLPISPVRYFACNICLQKFNSLDLLQEHRKINHHYFPRLSENGEFLVTCDLCTLTFGHCNQIRSHYEEKHQDKKKRSKEIRKTSHHSTGQTRQYLCDICGKSYTQSSHLWQHLRFHQGVKPFECPEENCGRKFTIRPDLNDHIRKCHTRERPYHCVVCDKRFLTGSVFYQHRLIHRGERRYGCQQCGKKFYRADALKNHERIHTGEKPFDCVYCTKTFRQRGDRDKHVRARHSRLDPKTRLMMQMQKFQLETAAVKKAELLQQGFDVIEVEDSDNLYNQVDEMQSEAPEYAINPEYADVEQVNENECDYEEQVTIDNAKVVVVNNAPQHCYFNM